MCKQCLPAGPYYWICAKCRTNDNPLASVICHKCGHLMLGQVTKVASDGGPQKPRKK